MRPGDMCHWSAGTDVENPEYQWLANDVEVGTGPDLYYSASSSFTLAVQVSNGNGDNAGDSREIDVAAENDQCFDQRPSPLRKPGGAGIRPSGGGGRSGAP
ncbi:MAG TPA: hypothetical protein VG916_02140 [Gemmatimonadaceae bacterium]|nr:hypothetical protein [Gemmatimonadaceae bacterium]